MSNGALDRKHMCSVPWEKLHPSLSPFCKPSLLFPFILFTLYPKRKITLFAVLTPIFIYPPSFFWPSTLWRMIRFLVPFPPFPSFLAVRASARDSTHAFNLGGSEPRSAACLQLRNFPPSLQSAHTLIERIGTVAWGHRSNPLFLRSRPVYSVCGLHVMVEGRSQSDDWIFQNWEIVMWFFLLINACSCKLKILKPNLFDFWAFDNISVKHFRQN